MSGFLAVIGVVSFIAVLVYMQRAKNNSVGSGPRNQNYRNAKIAGAVAALCIIGGGLSESSYGSVAQSGSSSSQENAAPTDSSAPTDSPAPETLLAGYDATLSTTDHQPAVCFASEDDYQKFVDTMVNKDREGAADILAGSSTIPSGSRVHAMNADLFKSYYELRVLSTDTVCYVGMIDSIQYHNITHD